MTFLVIIPARAGSKGLPGKNIKPLNGKSLIAYTIEAALEVFPQESVCVSTDSEEIAACARIFGAVTPFFRPKDLATDTASTEQVLIHAIDFFQSQGSEFKTVILLQPTSPFRRTEDIKKAIELFDDSLDMVVSVCETKSNPYYVLFEENEEGFLEKSKTGKFTRRQDCPKVYEFNGSIYVINVKSLREKGMAQFNKIKKLEMPKIYSVDIDDEVDWNYAEFLVKKLQIDQNL
ncbi:acylneuraminate cytidylyltransferase family protein [Cryomorphaceae bacterium 1068]|nr:acylneuraminate cytidylyltransferase family protein [Cryomorphaceae bacterium 1068]